MPWKLNRSYDFSDNPGQIKRGNQYKQKKEKGESWIHTIKSKNQIKFGADKKDQRQLG